MYKATNKNYLHSVKIQNLMHCQSELIRNQKFRKIVSKFDHMIDESFQKSYSSVLALWSNLLSLSIQPLSSLGFMAISAFNYCFTNIACLFNLSNLNKPTISNMLPWLKVTSSFDFKIEKKSQILSPTGLIGKAFAS